MRHTTGITSSLCWSALLSLLFAAAGAQADEPNAQAVALFEQKIHPILAGTCFRCHGDQKVAGRLRVDGREMLLTGGESGPALVPGKPEESLLLRAIERAEDVSAMPPDKPLRPDQVADVKAWIAAGAPWPEKAARFEAAKHWAYQPVVAPNLPEVRDTAWCRTNVDRFVLARLEAAGRSPALPADRRTLIRRATYDLTGLPPSADDVDAFVADDSPGSYEKLVDRLLASPHYGEQWGRHWLDVVRYADTAGENSDHPLPHAWRYRNWVIGALNRDLPYDEFVRQQVAGDLLAVDGPAEEYADRVVATGYLAIARRFGHDIEKDMHLTFEDTIDTLGKSILGLSLGCARCHDHKYEPISARDYYGLYGIFASTKFAYPGCEPKQLPKDMVPLVSPVETERLARVMRARLATIDGEIAQLEAAQAMLAAQAKTTLAGAARLLSAGEMDDSRSIDLAQGAQTPLERVAVRRGEVVQLAITPRGGHGADSTQVEFEIAEIGGQRRWNVTDLIDDLPAGNPHADRFGNPATWCFLDAHEGPIFLNENLTSIEGRGELRAWRHGDTPSVFVNASDKPVKVWTELPPRRFFMHPGAKGAVALAWISPVDATVSISGRIADAHPGGDGVGWQVTHFADPGLGDRFVELGKAGHELAIAQQRRKALAGDDRVTPVAYAVVDGTAANARIQKRGDPKDMGEEVPRKFPDFLGGQRVEREKSSGRRELAGWLADPANPLTARVMANRVWQGHFGRGLVKTPNDFGSRGAPPTHPELLDHLANEFVRGGWSIKSLHRLIMTSATYRQASSGGAADDLYASFPRRRLTAEELRDTLLVASGELDRMPGEAHPFPPESSWSFTQHGPFAAEYDTLKRSVYVMQKRNRRGRFFTLFDGADPNASTPLRDVTTVPTQALYFLNDPILHERAGKLAARAVAAAADERGRVDFVYRQLFGRAVVAEELVEASAFLVGYPTESPAAVDAVTNPPRAETHADEALAAYVRVLFASNEFLYVD